MSFELGICSEESSKSHKIIKIRLLTQGSRYVCVDYVIHDAVGDAKVRRLCITYDIWCKFHVNLMARTSRYPPEFTEALRSMVLRGYIPKFHLPAHGQKCHTIWCLTFAEGVGRVDGEGPEREWAATNELGRQTREMGPGTRHGVINDHICDQNFRRGTGLCEFVDRHHILLMTVVQMITYPIERWTV